MSDRENPRESITHASEEYWDTVRKLSRIADRLARESVALSFRTWSSPTPAAGDETNDRS